MYRVWCVTILPNIYLHKFISVSTQQCDNLLMSFPWLAYNVSTLYSVNKYPCPNFTLIDVMYCSKTDLQYLFYLIDVSM